MATYEAKKEDNDSEKDRVFKGASGGVSPEGYAIVESREVVDGVATRSKEEEEALVKAANEFQKSKLKASETEKKEADKEKETVVVEKEKVEPAKQVAPQPEKDKK